jgi:gliding motility-associated-like protein
MKITKPSTGEFGILDLNSRLVPLAVGLELLPGDHLISVVENVTGCADTISIHIACHEVVPMPDTIDIVLELGMDTVICLDPSELSSEIVSILPYCDDISTEVVNYDIEEECITITAEFLGDDIGCFVYCDENQICDTLVVFSVVVTEGFSMNPIAMDDDTITLINWHIINFDVTKNDTFNIQTDSIMIVQSPMFGTVQMNSDFTIDYIPDTDVCGKLDSFVYIINGPNGMDQATVYIDILCEDLTIFNGFSPNGDGINDFFEVVGIESFRDNELTIFNRWGNQVYYKIGYTNENGWDGTWEGRPLPDGTYFYVLDDGEGTIFSGYVQINR